MRKPQPDKSVSQRQVTQPDPIGLILLDSLFKPLYINRTARSVLCYPEPTGGNSLDELDLSRKLSLLVERCAKCNEPPSSLISGRRRYLCRTLLLHIEALPDSPQSAIILERISNRNDHVQRLAEDFKLTTREREVLLLVAEGLSSKDIAPRMGISQHTVRAFIHSIMIKFRVTTRSGIVGKLAAVFKSKL